MLLVDVQCLYILKVVIDDFLTRHAAQHGLRNRVFSTIQLLPLRYLDKTSDSLITRATNDVEALSELYTDGLISLFQDVFLIIGIIGAMLMMDVRLTLVSFCVIPNARYFPSRGRLPTIRRSSFSMRPPKPRYSSQHAIASIAQNRTALIIAHRLSTC